MVFAAAVVIVQILSHAPADEYGERLITACTQGLRQGACVLSNQGTVEEGSAVVAEVEWEDESYRVAVVRLGRPQAGKHEWTSGKVAFDGEDSLLDRWTTTGFTIATLAGDLTAVDEPPPPPPAKEPEAVPSRPSPRPESERARTENAPLRRPTLRTAAGLVVGQAMQGQSPRSGPWATIGYSPFDVPLGVRMRGAVVWAGATDADVRWATVAFGVESYLPVLERVAVVLAADGGPSVLTASSGGTKQRVHASVSLYAGCDVTIAGPFSFVAGGELGAGPTTTLSTTSGLVADRRFKLGGVVGLGARL